MIVLIACRPAVALCTLWLTQISSPPPTHTHTQPVPKNGSKLDFTWFEYSIERFEEIVSDYMAFWGDFKERHDGFEPTGASQKRAGS